MMAPITAIVLLALRPLAGIVIDPVIALPVGGLVGALCMGRIKQINQFAVSGLGKMSGVVIMLLGTGTLAGIISNSQLKDVIIDSLASGLPPYFTCADKRRVHVLGHRFDNSRYRGRQLGVRLDDYGAWGCFPGRCGDDSRLGRPSSTICRTAASSTQRAEASIWR